MNQVQFYDWYAAFDYDISFYRGLLTDCEGAILELAAGTGRATIPLAKDGHQIIALDLCDDMLSLARKKCNLPNITFVCADMASFSLPQYEGKIAAVFIAVNSFLLLQNFTKQKMCLARIAHHTKPGALLVLDIFHPPVFLANESFRGQPTLLASHPGSDGATLNHWFAGHHDCARQVVIGHNILELCTLEGETRKYPYTEIMRYLHRYELELLLENYGFELVEIYGWYDHRPFDSMSRKMIFLARKK